jgi:hypothetical protein
MHNYETCPSNDHDPAPQTPQQRPGEEQPHIGSFDRSGDVTEVSSFDLGLNVSSDHLDATHPSPQGAHEKTLSQLTESRSSIARQKLSEPLLSGYSKWKTAWRLQTIIVGLYILGNAALRLCRGTVLTL